MFCALPLLVFLVVGNSIFALFYANADALAAVTDYDDLQTELKMSRQDAISLSNIIQINVAAGQSFALDGNGRTITCGSATCFNVKQVPVSKSATARVTLRNFVVDNTKKPASLLMSVNSAVTTVSLENIRTVGNVTLVGVASPIGSLLLSNIRGTLRRISGGAATVATMLVVDSDIRCIFDLPCVDMPGAGWAANASFFASNSNFTRANSTALAVPVPVLELGPRPVDTNVLPLPAPTHVQLDGCNFVSGTVVASGAQNVTITRTSFSNAYVTVINAIDVLVDGLTCQGPQTIGSTVALRGRISNFTLRNTNAAASPTQILLPFAVASSSTSPVLVDFSLAVVTSIAISQVTLTNYFAALHSVSADTTTPNGTASAINLQRISLNNASLLRMTRARALARYVGKITIKDVSYKGAANQMLGLGNHESALLDVQNVTYASASFAVQPPSLFQVTNIFAARIVGVAVSGTGAFGSLLNATSVASAVTLANVTAGLATNSNLTFGNLVAISNSPKQNLFIGDVKTACSFSVAVVTLDHATNVSLVNFEVQAPESVTNATYSGQLASLFTIENCQNVALVNLLVTGQGRGSSFRGDCSARPQTTWIAPIVFESVANVSMQSVVFANNVHTCPSNARTSFIFFNDVPSVTISDSSFEQLIGNSSAIIFRPDSSSSVFISIRSSRFVNNAANFDSVDGAGGALHIVGAAPRGGALTINDTFFSNNSANAGGAIYSSNVNVTLENSRFWDNAATRGKGGAVWAIGNSKIPLRLTVSRSLFQRNSAVWRNASDGGLGSALAAQSFVVSVTECDFFNNSAVSTSSAVLAAISIDNGGAGGASAPNVSISNVTIGFNSGNLSSSSFFGPQQSVLWSDAASRATVDTACVCNNSVTAADTNTAFAIGISCGNYTLSNFTSDVSSESCLSMRGTLSCPSSGCSRRVPQLAEKPGVISTVSMPLTLPPALETVPPESPRSDVFDTTAGPIISLGGNATQSDTAASAQVALTSPSPGTPVTGVPLGTIVGAAVGATAALALLLILVTCCVLRRRRDKPVHDRTLVQRTSSEPDIGNYASARYSGSYLSRNEYAAAPAPGTDDGSEYTAPPRSVMNEHASQIYGRDDSAFSSLR